MIKVGVTGGIGSGKTLVCKIIESMGYPVYHADIEAKNLTDTHPAIIKDISRLLGNGVYENGILNRKKVGQLVFGNEMLLAKLNSIIHPIVAEDFENWVRKFESNSIVFKEAAILFESGAYKWVDKVIAVWAPEKIRIERVMQRDAVSEVDVKKRIQHQISENELIERSNFLVNNDGEELLTPQIVEIINKLLSK